MLHTLVATAASRARIAVLPGVARRAVAVVATTPPTAAAATCIHVASRACSTRTNTKVAAATMAGNAIAAATAACADGDLRCLFSGGVLDRAGALVRDGGTPLGRTAEGYVPAVVADPRSRVLLVHGGRPLLATCTAPAGDGVQTSSIVWLPPAAVATHLFGAGSADSAVTDALARELVVLGATRDDGSVRCAVDVSRLGGSATPLTADAILARLRDAGLLPATCSGAACGGGAACTAAATYAFSDGRELLAGTAWAGAGTATAAGAAPGAPAYLVHPTDMHWPIAVAEAAAFGHARAILAWHARARFCGCT